MNEASFRNSLVDLLEGRGAHVDPRRALSGIAPATRGTRPSTHVAGVWEELEHMRLAQEDILRYTLDPSWKSPDWPAGYWPQQVETVSGEEWERSVSAFFRDLEEVVRLVRDESIELTANLPHGEDHTYLREILLIADHNAYHLGQIVQTRKLLGDWSG